LQKLNKKTSKKLNEIELEKENMLVKLNDARAACDKLKSENTMLVEKNKSLENKLKDSKDHLKKFSSDKLKRMLNVQKHNSDKSGLGFDKFVFSTSLASNSERITLFVKPMKFEEFKANVAYLDKGKKMFV
jgi:arginyl-tRNA synthetase